jgi:hypothetical protein
VHTSWSTMIKATSEYPSEELHQVNTCIDTAIRCVDSERNNRPTIAGILDALNMTETHIPTSSKKTHIPQGQVWSTYLQTRWKLQCWFTICRRQLLGYYGSLSSCRVIFFFKVANLLTVSCSFFHYNLCTKIFILVPANSCNGKLEKHIWNRAFHTDRLHAGRSSTGVLTSIHVAAIGTVTAP